MTEIGSINSKGKKWGEQCKGRIGRPGEGRRNPADITLRLSSTKTGDQPDPDW